MTSQGSRQPITPDPLKTLALKKDTWVKIKSCTTAMQTDGFKVGDVVLIRKVRESSATPEGQWTSVVGDTQYAIGRKVLVKYSTEEDSPSEGIHLVPHANIRSEKYGKASSPIQLKKGDMVWLAEAHSWPASGNTVTLPKWTQVRINIGPESKRGGSTSHFSSPKFWNYQVTYFVSGTKIEIMKHKPYVDAANFYTKEEQEPADPTT